MKMDLEIFAPTALISPIPPWFLSEPQIDFTIHNRMQKGEIEGEIKYNTLEYINTVYSEFIQMYLKTQRQDEQVQHLMYPHYMGIKVE